MSYDDRNNRDNRRGNFRSGGGSSFRGGGGSSFRGGGGGRRPFNRGPVQMHKAVCSECGKETEVPFKPIEGRPVFCKECYMAQKDKGSFGKKKEETFEEDNEKITEEKEVEDDLDSDDDSEDSDEDSDD